MISYRKASGNDLDTLLALIEEGFSVQQNFFDKKEGWEHRVLFSYLFNISPDNLERVYLAEDHGLLAGAVGLIPQQIFFGELKIPIWAISPVVTHPQYRSQGIAGKCIRYTLEEIRKQGIPAVFLWGLPDYYPRLGFVPLLPRFKTKITPAQIRERTAAATGDFRVFENKDLESLARIYNQGNTMYWLQPERTIFWWRQRAAEIDIELGNIREVPFPKKENFVVWENHIKEVCGYLYFEMIPEQTKIIIKEGATLNLETALSMVQTFAKRYLKPNWTLYIRGTPRHLLNIAAYRLGGTHLNPTPLAGMIKIIDWPVFLSRIAPLFTRNDSTQSVTVNFDINKSILRLGWNPDCGLSFEIHKPGQKGMNYHSEADLTRLIFGFYDAMDFEDLCDSSLRVIFPSKYPFIWDANYLY